MESSCDIVRLCEVSTEFFLDSFAICYSEQGCNKRTAEEAVILHWNDYVTDCEGKWSESR